MLASPSNFEVFPLYYVSKCLIIIIGLGVIVYACVRKPK